MATSADQVKSAEASAAQALRPSSISKRVLVVDTPRFAPLIRRMLGDRFEVECATDGLAAVKVFRAWKPDAIVAELSVPGGGLRLAELLDMNVTGQHTPFILTCIKPPADLENRARKAGADNLLVKPFPPSVLIERIGNVLNTGLPAGSDSAEEEEDLLKAIKARLKEIDGLPPFPATHAEILRLARSEKADSEDIAEQIQMDPNFLATVLKLANSSHYGFRRKVDSLKLAVSLLGFGEIANLVMSLQVFRELGGYESKTAFDLMGFWKHSVGTGFVARAIAQKLKAEVELCFMAGMLHDIGKVVLDRFFGDFFGRALDVAQAQNMRLVDAELETLGVTHAQVGGYLAANWDFADTLIEAIVCHHDPTRARHYPRLASVVHVANAICHSLSYGASGEVVKQHSDDPDLRKALWKLGVGPQAMRRLIDLGKGQLESADSFLGTLTGRTG